MYICSHLIFNPPCEGWQISKTQNFKNILKQSNFKGKKIRKVKEIFKSQKIETFQHISKCQQKNQTTQLLKKQNQNVNKIQKSKNIINEIQIQTIDFKNIHNLFAIYQGCSFEEYLVSNHKISNWKGPLLTPANAILS